MKIVKKVAHYTHNLDKKPEGYTNEITYNLQGNNTFQIIFGRTFNMHNKCHLCSHLGSQVLSCMSTGLT